MHVRGGSQRGLHQLRQERVREEYLKCEMKIRSLVLDVSLKFLENIQWRCFFQQEAQQTTAVVAVTFHHFSIPHKSLEARTC